MRQMSKEKLGPKCSFPDQNKIRHDIPLGMERIDCRGEVLMDISLAGKSKSTKMVMVSHIIRKHGIDFSLFYWKHLKLQYIISYKPHFISFQCSQPDGHINKQKQSFFFHALLSLNSSTISVLEDTKKTPTWRWWEVGKPQKINKRDADPQP